MQGCPISVMLLNALMSVLSEAIEKENPQMLQQSYVDDLTLMAEDDQVISVSRLSTSLT